MRVPGGGAVRNHRHRQVGGVGQESRADLHVEHGGQAAEALRTDAEGVDLLVQLRARSSSARFDGRARSVPDVDRRHQRFLGQQSPFPAVPPIPMPRMPGGHQPAPIVGTVFQHPVDQESEGSASRTSTWLRSRHPGRDDDLDLSPARSGVITAGVLSLLLRALARPGRPAPRRAACCRGGCRRGARPR